jgi:hypothetical protein
MDALVYFLKKRIVPFGHLLQRNDVLTYFSLKKIYLEKILTLGVKKEKVCFRHTFK